ncbi:MAG TPA: DNA/RNA helicase, partial [Microbacterium sp.]|nr:DNA/RNA helicase [Microbacterium sp.]
MTAPYVLEEDILAHTDPGSFERGFAYARDGKVLYAIWNSERRRLNGQVSGSGGRPYSCAIEFADDGSIAVSRCACPVRLECKHVVAVLLVSNEKQERPAPVRSQTSGSRVPAWRALLDASPRTAETVPLALGVEVRQRAAR